MARAPGLVEIACLPEPLDGERLREITRAFDENPLLMAKTDTSGGTLVTADEVRGGLFFRVYVDGGPVGFYVLYLHQADGRTEAVITLAYGRAAFDFCTVALPLVEAQCAGCAGLAMLTKRRGLVRKLAGAGYAITDSRNGVTHMRKAL